MTRANGVVEDSIKSWIGLKNKILQNGQIKMILHILAHVFKFESFSYELTSGLYL